jgi:hypothetical protein
MRIGLRSIATSLWVAAGCVIAAGLVWPYLVGQRSSEAETKAIAETAIARIAVSESGAVAGQGHYVTFGGSVQERQTALPKLQLDPQADESFQFDAHDAGNGGGIRLRAVTKPEAIAAGRVVPLVVSHDLPSPAPAPASAPENLTQP